MVRNYVNFGDAYSRTIYSNPPSYITWPFWSRHRKIYYLSGYRAEAKKIASKSGRLPTKYACVCMCAFTFTLCAKQKEKLKKTARTNRPLKTFYYSCEIVMTIIALIKFLVKFGKIAMLFFTNFFFFLCEQLCQADGAV